MIKPTAFQHVNVGIINRVPKTWKQGYRYIYIYILYIKIYWRSNKLVIFFVWRIFIEIKTSVSLFEDLWTEDFRSSKLFLTRRNSPQWARFSTLWMFHDHTQTHHTRQDSSGRVISPTKAPLPDNTQHSQQTDIHAPGGDSNPQSLQASGRRPARPLGLAY